MNEDLKGASLADVLEKLVPCRFFALRRFLRVEESSY